MNKAQTLLLNNLALVLNGQDCLEESDENYIKEAKQQAVYSLVAPWEQSMQYVAQNVRVDHEHGAISKLFLDNKIPFVILKGYASASYYIEPVRRCMGDVDVYVPQEYHEEVISLLGLYGYKREASEHDRHISFRKGKIEIEVHFEIKGIPNGKDGIATSNIKAERIVRTYLNKILEDAVLVETDYGQMILPSDFHHGMIMLLHVAGHMITGSGVGLRHLCDWAVYATKVDIVNDKHKYEEMGLWKFALLLSEVCHRYLKAECYHENFYDNIILESMIEDILEAGNFGRKTQGRSGSYLLANEEGIIKGVYSLILREYPQIERKKILFPYYCIVYLFDFLKKRKNDEKRINVVGEIKKAKNRRKLYKEFKLFER